MVGLFMVLVVVCALFFGFGYSMGRGATVSATGLGSPSPAVVVLGQRAPGKTPAPEKATSAETAAAAIPDAASDTHPTAAGIYFLQVAAVTKQEDAEALVSALKKKDYAVFATNSVPTDKLFTCRLARLATRKTSRACVLSWLPLATIPSSRSRDKGALSPGCAAALSKGRRTCGIRSVPRSRAGRDPGTRAPAPTSPTSTRTDAAPPALEGSRDRE